MNETALHVEPPIILTNERHDMLDVDMDLDRMKSHLALDLPGCPSHLRDEGLVLFDGLARPVEARPTADGAVELVLGSHEPEVVQLRRYAQQAMTTLIVACNEERDRKRKGQPYKNKVLGPLTEEPFMMEPRAFEEEDPYLDFVRDLVSRFPEHIKPEPDHHCNGWSHNLWHAVRGQSCSG